MGFFAQAAALKTKLKLFGGAAAEPSPRRGFRTCRIEPMEPRYVLSGEHVIEIGAVFIETTEFGAEAEGDRFEVTWQGGAANTHLTQLVISGDKNGLGLSEGDVFFDTADGGLGHGTWFPFQVHADSDIKLHQISVSVADGGTDLILHVTGWEAGMKLIFTIDVDEWQNDRANSIVDGAEFEGSHLVATFTDMAGHHSVLVGSGVFMDEYNSQIPAGIDVPLDGSDGEGLADRTAGVGFSAVQQPLPVTISGTVYHDVDLDNQLDANEQGIAGVQLELLRWNGAAYVSTGLTTTTDANGHYSFTHNQPGTFRVVQTQPDGYFSVGSQAGHAGGAASGVSDGPDAINGITLLGGEHHAHNNFGEALPVALSGTVYHDRNDNGLIDAGEEGIGGVRIEVHRIGGGGSPVVTYTNANGTWSVSGLAPGVYQVIQTQPDGWLDGKDSIGSAGGQMNGNDNITQISLVTSGQSGTNYNFGELKTGSIGGKVFSDPNDNVIFDPGETPIAGVTMELLDAQGNVIATTTTNAQGMYSFHGLAPGVYGVRQVQPAGYYDGNETPGSLGGQRTANDTITLISVGSDQHGTGYDFGELPPSSISGRVHADLNGNCEYDPGELPLAGVVIELLDQHGVVIATTTTDANGMYYFNNLPPGTYGVREIQPAGYFDGGDKIGSAGGVKHADGDRIDNIALGAGVTAVNYNFCEIPPASISGRVFHDLDGDCTYDPGEPPIANVVIELLNEHGEIVATTLTDANGMYKFENLRPGTYSIREIQPEGYYDGGDKIGSAGGVKHPDGDRIDQIVLGAGVDAAGYDFCEKGPGAISGYVFIDGPVVMLEPGQTIDPASLAGMRNGLRTPDDIPLGGVQLILADANGNFLYDANGNLITAYTNAQGFYRFSGLAPGQYTVYQVQPSGVFDGVDTPGTTGGVAANFGSEGHPWLQGLNHKYDAIARITVVAGSESFENNFSEIATGVKPPIPPDFPEPPKTSYPLPDPSLSISPPTPPGAAPLTRTFAAPNAFISYGGGVAPVMGTSWHLSIINGGQPRSTGDRADVLARVATSRLDVFNAHEALSQARWTLDRQDGDDGSVIFFGAPNGIPVTGDWNGDGVTDVAVFLDGEWFIDLNGNGRWDDGDLWVELGKKGDQPLAGDWDGDGKTDIAIFGPEWPNDPRAVMTEPGLPDRDNVASGATKNLPPRDWEASTGKRVMRRTSTGESRADVIDHVFYYGHRGDIGVVGDWNGDGIATIGVFNNGTWILDDNGDGRWLPGETMLTFGKAGDLPVVGDWSGDGIDRIGIYRNGLWILDSNGNGIIDDEDERRELGGPNDIPVVGDWNGDGIDQIGIYRAEGSAQRNDQLTGRPGDARR